jgi:hypothetical protein
MTVELQEMGTLPFCKGTVVLPRSRRRAALAGMALAAPSRPPVVRMHRVVAAALTAVGARWLPHVDESVWPSWIGDEQASALLADLHSSVGHFDAAGLHVPRQPGRRSLALLLLDGDRPVAFVKAKADGSSLRLEADVMAALADGGHPPLRVAEPVASGFSGVHWLATTPISGRHVPATDAPTPDYEAWLDERLRPLLPPEPVPQHWRAAHGDLAPWNLRCCGPDTWLLDWESVTWAPPGADRTYFTAASTVVRGGVPAAVPEEAARYWIGRIQARNDVSDPLNRRLLELLPRMAEGRQ